MPEPRFSGTGAAEWKKRIRITELSLGETVDHLRSFHRLAPILFFNGNTFAVIGRRITFTNFADLPEPRRREAASFVAH